MAELGNKQPCRNGCGKEIGFHEKWLNKAKTSKIPVEVLPDGKWKAHECPNGQKTYKSGGASVDMTPLVEKLDKIAALLERISGQLANGTTNETDIA